VTGIVARGLAGTFGSILFGGRWIVHCGSPVPTDLALFQATGYCLVVFKRAGNQDNYPFFSLFNAYL
jgi:hypothetical protein